MYGGSKNTLPTAAAPSSLQPPVFETPGRYAINGTVDTSKQLINIGNEASEGTAGPRPNMAYWGGRYYSIGGVVNKSPPRPSAEALESNLPSSFLILGCRLRLRALGTLPDDDYCGAWTRNNAMSFLLCLLSVSTYASNEWLARCLLSRSCDSTSPTS